MRFAILIAATLLMSTSAQAGEPRGLSATTCSEQAASGQSKQTEAANVDVPKAKEQSAAKNAQSSPPRMLVTSWFQSGKIARMWARQRSSPSTRSER